MQDNSLLLHHLDKPITVRSLKDQIVPECPAFSKTRSSRFDIVWVQEGCWSINVNEHSLRLTKGTVCFLIPGQIRLAVFAENVKGFHISISEEFFHLTADKGIYTHYQCNFLDRPWCRKLEQEKAALLELILPVIRQECMGEVNIKTGILLGWLKVLLEYFDWNPMHEILERPTRRDQEISKQFFKLLADRFTTEKKVSYYARVLTITPTHLNQVIKKVSGSSASYHIQHCVIMEAKRQAINENRSMKEISYALGFDDISHFSKFFKNNVGLSFTNFKKSIYVA
jgi:AraC-like DNA-binding protein